MRESLQIYFTKLYKRKSKFYIDLWCKCGICTSCTTEIDYNITSINYLNVHTILYDTFFKFSIPFTIHCSTSEFTSLIVYHLQITLTCSLMFKVY